MKRMSLLKETLKQMLIKFSLTVAVVDEDPVDPTKSNSESFGGGF